MNIIVKHTSYYVARQVRVNEHYSKTYASSCSSASKSE